jgi:hypothetical protein
MSPLVRPNSGGNIKAGCRRLGVPDATARPWSTWIKSHSPPVGRYVQTVAQQGYRFRVMGATEDPLHLRVLKHMNYDG